MKLKTLKKLKVKKENRAAKIQSLWAQIHNSRFLEKICITKFVWYIFAKSVKMVDYCWQCKTIAFPIIASFTLCKTFFCRLDKNPVYLKIKIKLLLFRQFKGIIDCRKKEFPMIFIYYGKLFAIKTSENSLI